MEKLSERIGLYDLWAMFFPGTVGALEMLFFSGTFWSIYRKRAVFSVFKQLGLDKVSTWVIMLIVSIFLGLVLQEIGRWLRKVKKTKTAEEMLLNQDESGTFSKEEISSLNGFLELYGWNGENKNTGNIIFHRINAAAQECGVAEKYVKLSILQNMSSSLSAAMLLGVIGSVSLALISLTCRRISIAIALLFIAVGCGILVVLFFNRAKRFNRYWVRNLIFAMSRKNINAEKVENAGEKRS